MRTASGLGRDGSNLVLRDDGRVLLTAGQGYDDNGGQGPTAVTEVYQ